MVAAVAVSAVCLRDGADPGPETGKALLAAPVGPKAGTGGAWLLPGCGSTAAAPSRRARLEAASRIEACRCEPIRPRDAALAGEAFLNCGCGGGRGAATEARATRWRHTRGCCRRGRRGRSFPRPSCAARPWPISTRCKLLAGPNEDGAQTASWCSRLPRVARRLQRVGTGLTVREWQGTSSG